MAQDLLKISVEAFELQLPRLHIDVLKNLLRGIYELKWEKGKNWPDDIIMDIERKETKINRELMRRGFLKSKDYEDYFAWLKKINTGKRHF